LALVVPLVTPVRQTQRKAAILFLIPHLLRLLLGVLLQLAAVKLVVLIVLTKMVVMVVLVAAVSPMAHLVLEYQVKVMLVVYLLLQRGFVLAVVEVQETLEELVILAMLVVVEMVLLRLFQELQSYTLAVVAQVLIIVQLAARQLAGISLVLEVQEVAEMGELILVHHFHNRELQI